MKYLKIQLEGKVAGLPVAPSAKIPVKGAVKVAGQEFPADELLGKVLAAMDLADQDGGAIDGDVDINFKGNLKWPFLSQEYTGHITLTVTD